MVVERASQRSLGFEEDEEEDLDALLAAEEEVAGEWARPRAFDQEIVHDRQSVLFLGLDEDGSDQDPAYDSGEMLSLDHKRQEPMEVEEEQRSVLQEAGKNRDKETHRDAHAFDRPLNGLSSFCLNMPLAHKSTPDTASARDSTARSSIPKYLPANPIPATTLDGQSITIPRRRRTRGYKTTAYEANTSIKFLSEDLDTLMQRVHNLQEPEVRPLTRVRTASNVMWAEKYRPKRFTELIGDDRVHREALRWVKTWDACVFHREMPLSRKRSYGKEAEHPDTYTDPYLRPSERVLLISGPPGLGKTTLAHVVAKQAGYRVYELNASDARTAADVEQRVRVALESDSLRGGSNQPTLVVIDEIDGATGGGSSDGLGTMGFVRALVRLIEQGKGDRKKRFELPATRRKKGAVPILRPIVCICNDLYAPALRPLRPYSKILRFHRPPTLTLARRLLQICAEEEMRADTRSLSLLCELTHGDFRACLHALEMLHSQDAVVTDDAITQSTIGIKDSVVSQQRLFAQLFCQVDATPAQFHARRTRQSKATQADRIAALVQELSGYGEYDRLASACFEHYLHLRLPDQGWQRYGVAHDWLHFAQSITQRAYGGGGAGNAPAYELFAFVPWTFVPWHLLFASLANPLPEQISRTDYENHLRLEEMKLLISTVRAQLPASIQPYHSSSAIATDLGPALTRILSPDLKLHTSNSDTASKAALDRLVDTMLSLSLAFVPDRGEDGILVHRIQPPIDAFCQFSGENRWEVGPNRHGVKQHVQRELDREAARRKSTQPTGPASLPTNLSTSAANETTQKKKLITYDFFGRAIASATTNPSGISATTATQQEKDLKKDFRVFFRFHEGYSNAVRKSIKLSSLI
ncbi:Chromosome transmission fidelity protein 18 [Malassezia yamatoensis]|uniref:Chromosome transmission fidelity protein 18 n=1 Tax=Malassezia yamatoensis TaxID=253288 RepID=A0AAJ5YUW1_9BASI|nr:Chromosome transmission fidelity protein 18 [Malassezia yamatoensis]